MNELTPERVRRCCCASSLKVLSVCLINVSLGSIANCSSSKPFPRHAMSRNNPHMKADLLCWTNDGNISASQCPTSTGCFYLWTGVDDCLGQSAGTDGFLKVLLPSVSEQLPFVEEEMGVVASAAASPAVCVPLPAYSRVPGSCMHLMCLCLFFCSPSYPLPLPLAHCDCCRGNPQHPWQLHQAYVPSVPIGPTR